MKKFNNLFLLINEEKDGKFCACAKKVSASLNLLAYINMYKDICTLNVCQTWKEATETAAAWNETYKRNGTYMYQ